MPYIKSSKRVHSVPVAGTMNNPGELNFALSTIVNAYLITRELPNTYNDYNEVIGALESCKLEVYRRLVAPLENEKLEQHGDVYTEADEITPVGSGMACCGGGCSCTTNL